ncbi:MAG: hypothetical protein ABL958_01250 [Bdellovibrionia bacterium]
MAKVWTLSGVIWLLSLVASSASAQTLFQYESQEPAPAGIEEFAPPPNTEMFKFNYGGEMLSVPMIPLGDDGKPVAEFVELAKTITNQEYYELQKRRELKLQAITFLLSKMKFTYLTKPVMRASDAVESWTGPIQIPNAARWWDRKSHWIIEYLLARFDRQLWNTLQTEKDPRLVTSRGITIGIPVGIGIGPARFLQIGSFSIGVESPGRPGEKPNYFVRGEYETAAPGSRMAGLAIAGIKFEFFRERSVRHQTGDKTHTIGYFAGVPLPAPALISVGRQRTRPYEADRGPVGLRLKTYDVIEGDAQMPSAAFNIGFSKNMIPFLMAGTALAAPTLSTVQQAWQAGSIEALGATVILGVSWYAINFLSSLHAAITVKDQRYLWTSQGRTGSGTVAVDGDLIDVGGEKVDANLGLIATSHEKVLSWSAQGLKRFLRGTLFSSKKQCAALLLYR